MVNVAPELTDTEPFNTYGLSAAVHVVFAEIEPETFVGPELLAGWAALNNSSGTTNSTDNARRVATRTTQRRNDPIESDPPIRIANDGEAAVLPGTSSSTTFAPCQ
jgi:hypothetical protein